MSPSELDTVGLSVQFRENIPEKSPPEKTYPAAIPPTPPSNVDNHRRELSIRFSSDALRGSDFTELRRGAKILVRSSVRNDPAKVSTKEIRSRGRA